MRLYLETNPQTKNRITQAFWARESYYSQFWLNWHEGIDINVTPWVPTPVFAVKAWTIKIDNQWAYGKHIMLFDYVNRVKFTYAHLSKIYYENNTEIIEGQEIGMSWETWNSSAIHVHLMAQEIDESGKVINTNNWFNWAVPIEYDELKDQLYVKLTREPDCSCDELKEKLELIRNIV